MQEYNFSTVNGFKFFIQHNINKNIGNATELDGHHIHDACEIYVNVSGDVSFMVENNIYPVKHGEAIITRPYEYHHAIYHSNAAHECYWMLFSSEGNEKLLPSFFQREPGEGNHVIMQNPNGEELIHTCMLLNDSPCDGSEKIMAFWTLIHLLNNGKTPKKNAANMLRTNLREVLYYIDAALLEPITVKRIAHDAHVSVNTLERWFKAELNISPIEYITRKRILHAVNILRGGGSVQQAALDSGFNDVSYFIKQFKRYYGITPHKYIQ